MGLTVTEKEHWKQRIALRIEKKISAMYTEAPNLRDRIKQDARKRALESLGLTAMQTELDTIDREKQSFEKRANQVSKEMLAHIRGVPVDEITGYYGCQRSGEVLNAVARRQSAHEDELLAEHAVGRRILQLQREKEELIDVVWLASSPREVKELWVRVNELLGDDQTQLQRDAMNIEAVDDK